MRALGSWLGRAFGAVLTVALAIVIVLGLFGLGFSGGIGDSYIDLSDPDAPQRFSFVVTAEDADSITLESGEGDELARAGEWGVEFPGGYGQIGEIVTETDLSVTRRFSLEAGDPPVPGTVGRLDPAYWPGDPATAGLQFDDVSFTTELGSYPAWLIGGQSSTWVVVVHHQGTDRRDGLRLVAPAAEAGAATLLVTYRNDREAPVAPTGRYQWGRTEWRDLEGAVGYAVSNGAADVVLAGYGMGGSIVLSFLQESSLASRVAGVILDSPAVALDATVAHDLSQDQLGSVIDMPIAINKAARLIAGWRFDIEWNKVDYSGVPIDVPMLLFHGDDDTVMPLAESQALASRSALVDLRVVAGAGFGESWNVDPDGYEAAVSGFLANL